MTDPTEDSAGSTGEAKGGGDGRGSGESGKNSNNGSVIDLSASSWQDDPFLDVLAAGVDRGDDKGPTTKTVTDGSAAWEGRRSSSRTGSVSDPSHGHGQRSKHQRGTLKKALSSRGGDSRNNEGGDKATDRRRPAAPLTSISALFGGGAGGNLANGSSRSAKPPPFKTSAGTKRPRSTVSTVQRTMRPPLPPSLSAASGAPAWATPAAGGDRTVSLRESRGFDSSPEGFSGSGDAEYGMQRKRAEDQLWPDKHRPREVSGLAVHAKKVDEVRHWLSMALATRPDSSAYRLLALLGPPGSAKSTMVRLLAEEMGVELAEWQDTSRQGGPAYRPTADGPALGGERVRHELGSSYQSSMDSFEEFMKRSSYRALPMLTTKPASTDARPEGGGNRRGKEENVAAPSEGGRVAGTRGRDGGGSKKRGTGPGGSARIVLLEELPEAYGEDKKERLRRLMAECARSSPCPIVISWSQSSESNSYQSQLEHVLSRETLRLPGVQITTCNPINATLLRQHLKGILTLEGVSDPRGLLVESAIATCSGDIRHALLNLQMSVGGGSSSTSSASCIFERSIKGSDTGGNPRRGAAGRRTTSATAKVGRSTGGSRRTAKQGIGGKAGKAAAVCTTQRDTFLSQFRALGKLLYAKRLPPSAGVGGDLRGKGGGKQGGVGIAEGGERGPLEFVPEDVLAQSGMDLGWALAFLQYHCVDFFTDEFDLAQELEYFSDADIFASRMFDSSRGFDAEGSVFPQRYGESIASRATAVSNKHSASNRMRTFGAPKSFEMRRKRNEAAGALRRFVGDAWDASGGDVNALWASSRHLKEAVDTELLPTARLITGEWEADAALRAILDRFMREKRRRQQEHLQPESTSSSMLEATDNNTERLSAAGDASRISTSIWPSDGLGAGEIPVIGLTDRDPAFPPREHAPVDEEDEIGEF